MKPKLLTHSLWTVAAAGTFVLGYSLAKPGLNEDGAESNRSTTVGKMASALSRNTPLGTDPNASSTTNASPGASSRNVLMSQEAIDALAKEAFTDPNPLTRSLAFAKLLESMTPENAGALMQSLKDNRVGGQQMQVFLYAWGALDIKGAHAHAETLEGRSKEHFLNSTLAGWANKEPSSAIAWVDTMEDGDAKNRYRGSLVGGLADHDIGVATNYVLTRAQAGDKQATQLIQTVAGEELRKNGPAAATMWGERLPEGAVKNEALEQIAGTYVQRDPQAAAAWVEKFATAPNGADIVEEVGEEWAERDPKAAVAWLDSLADGQAKSEGTFSALREWTRRDPKAASEYLAAMPASAAKDSAVSGFARSLSREDPESAVIWARTITNEASRVQSLTQAGQAWFRRDPTAAATWLQNSKLPPATQQAIINPPRDDRRRG